MNDTEQDPVGSLAEELSKLMGAVSGLSGARTGSEDSSGATGHDAEAGEHDHHLANGSASCQICPVCQTIAFVRSTSPEVREHLTASAVAFAAAARGLADAAVAHQSRQRADHSDGARESGVENIDLSEDDPWD